MLKTYQNTCKTFIKNTASTCTDAAPPPGGGAHGSGAQIQQQSLSLHGVCENDESLARILMCFERRHSKNMEVARKHIYRASPDVGSVKLMEVPHRFEAGTSANTKKTVKIRF